MPLANLSNPLGGGAGATTGIIAGGTIYGLNGQTITGNASGAWTVTANGTNQNITLTPSGSGNVVVSSNLSVNGTGTSTFSGTVIINLASGDASLTLRRNGTTNTTLLGDGANTYIQSGTGMGLIIQTNGGTAITIGSSQTVSVASSAPATNSTSGALVVGSNIGLSGNSGGPSYFGGNIISAGTIALASSAPASASGTGSAGTITWDSSFIYVCTDTNTWKRVSIATW